MIDKSIFCRLGAGGVSASRRNPGVPRGRDRSPRRGASSRGRPQQLPLMSPGGALPILMRWRRILATSAGLVMTAMSFISDRQRGQISGSTSYTFAIGLAHAERQVRCVTVCASGGPASAVRPRTVEEAARAPLKGTQLLGFLAQAEKAKWLKDLKTPRAVC